MENITPATTEAVQQTMSQRVSQLLERFPVILQLLKFAAIGVLNTALDFIVLNILSKAFGVDSGLRLGQLNVIGFLLAVVQSYYWNRYWAFASQKAVTLLQNAVRLVLVGLVGAGSVGLVLLGAAIAAQPIFYLIILGVFVVLQVVLWNAFGFEKPVAQNTDRRQFVTFLVVSAIGLLINSALIALLTSQLSFSGNADLDKNLAKIVATAASLVWNFIGYKLLVFKR